MIKNKLSKKEQERQKAIKELIKTMKKGWNFEYKMYKNRNEIYDD